MTNPNTFHCLICNKPYKSYKSLHRHKTLSHPETIVDLKQQLQNRINQYNQTPKTCKFCSVPFEYTKRYNVFCNQSCSTKYNFNQQSDQTRQSINSARLDTWRSKYGQLKRDVPKPYSRKNPQYTIYKNCITCHSTFISKSAQHKYCSPLCNTSKNNKSIYRTACKFNISSTNHPELFNSDLIQQYGWYNPTNKPGNTNLSGVCWDHLYRIEDGFKNNISPIIMSHPANAELVPWKINKSRTTSIISYSQLLSRIQQWNNGNRNLPTFLNLAIQVGFEPTSSEELSD